MWTVICLSLSILCCKHKGIQRIFSGGLFVRKALIQGRTQGGGGDVLFHNLIFTETLISDVARLLTPHSYSHRTFLKCFRVAEFMSFCLLAVSESKQQLINSAEKAQFKNIFCHLNI